MKTASKIVLTCIMLVLFAGMTFAQNSQATATPVKKAGTTIAAPGKFIDENKNGVCDNHESKIPGTPGKNFVDKDSDGKCDLCGHTGACKGSGDCKGSGPGCGKGCSKAAGKGNCGQGNQHRNGCCAPGTGSKK